MVEVLAAESAMSASPAEGFPLPEVPAQDPGDRVRAALRAHYAAVWRTVQALGIPKSSAEDVTQRVFVVFSRKIDRVRVGKERAFLLATAVRTAANARRQASQRREEAADSADDLPHPSPDPEYLLQTKQAKELLDGVLSSMPVEQRNVFVLFELEQLTLDETAQALGVPRGTAASRLRAARAIFKAGVERLRCQLARIGGHR
jgi:RNA polymerase sigma-70 factor (ECF subfamily)